MQCQWDALMGILPPWIREAVDKPERDTLQELRLRIHKPLEMVSSATQQRIQRPVQAEDIQFCINTASRYSPWSVQTVRDGYIAAPGGHRIGLCGSVVSNGQIVTGIKEPTSICIRISRDFPGLAARAANLTGSTLIIGVPGSGKTTLLRDFVRQKSTRGIHICVVDERREIFPVVNNRFCYNTGSYTDVISGCNKQYGIETVLRSMSPHTIAVDEITAANDCEALLHAGWCGVSLIATAHAGCREDLFSRPVYKPLLDANLFDNLLIVDRDKSWHTERMKQ